MKYLKESGAIITPQNYALTILTGTPGQVDFPEEMIWQFHKTNPGIVYKFAHVHPPGMTELSSRDIQTMKTWAFALYPYPIRMSTIVVEDLYYDAIITETTFLSYLQPKEFWKKGTQREFTIIQEKQEVTNEGIADLNEWQQMLINISFTS